MLVKHWYLQTSIATTITSVKLQHIQMAKMTCNFLKSKLKLRSGGRKYHFIMDWSYLNIIENILIPGLKIIWKTKLQNWIAICIYMNKRGYEWKTGKLAVWSTARELVLLGRIIKKPELLELKSKNYAIDLTLVFLYKSQNLEQNIYISSVDEFIVSSYRRYYTDIDVISYYKYS